MKKTLNRCRKCNAPIIPAWKICPACDKKQIKSKTKPTREDQRDFISSLVRTNEMNTWALSQYNDFFRYFGDDLKPFIEEWKKHRKSMV